MLLLREGREGSIKGQAGGQVEGLMALMPPTLMANQVIDHIDGKSRHDPPHYWVDGLICHLDDD